MNLSYDTLLSLRKERHPTFDDFDESVKKCIDVIRESLKEFIKKNTVVKKIYFDKRKHGFKKVFKKPDILGRDKLTKDDSIKNDINSDFNMNK